MTPAERAARAGLAALLALATLGARPAPRPAPLAPAGKLAPDIVLARYARALATLERPHAIAFDYAVEQLGLRNMEQTHRVYRSGLDERDETRNVDGYELKRPSVRILANRTYRYDIAATAPKPASYRFAYAGAYPHGNAYTYVFRTASFATTPFDVTEVEIDGTHFLPSLVRFKIAGDAARGSGELAYAPNGRYWVVVNAQVSAHLANGTTAHEHIAWSDYSFPTSLPPSTFEAPHPHAVEETEAGSGAAEASSP